MLARLGEVGVRACGRRREEIGYRFGEEPRVGRSGQAYAKIVLEGATMLQHDEDPGGHQLAVHPVEGLGERGVPKGAQARRQCLRPQPQPPLVGQLPPGGQPGRLFDHASIGVYTDDLGEEIG